jgi:hypothetical protein
LLIFENSGALNQIRHSAPWILDPTTTGAWVHRGPGRGRGPWVHRGPTHLNEGVRDPGPSIADRMVLEGGGARRELAGVRPLRRSWPLL